MAGKTHFATLVLATVLTAAALVGTTEAVTTYFVGNISGWTVPTGGATEYSNWATNYTFVTGDILVFNFLTSQHDVARVTKDAFDGCNSNSPIYLQTVGPANYTLNATGEYYFICTFGQHCANGQKLALNVSSTSGGSPTPSPSPPSPAPTPTPTPTPSGTPPPSPTPATPSPSPPPSASSPPPPPATPSPSPPPSVSSPPPPPGTTSPPSSSPPPPSDTNSPPPPPPSSDASKAVAGFSITVMSIAMVALF